MRENGKREDIGEETFPDTRPCLGDELKGSCRGFRGIHKMNPYPETFTKTFLPVK